MSNKRPLFALGVILFGLVACAPNAPLSIAADNAEEIKARPTEKLCIAYYHLNGGEVVREELTRRGEVLSKDWPFIDKGQITVGMSPCAVEAAWGATTLHDHAGGSLDSYHYTSGYFATFKDGRVVGFIGPP